jgi:hypothetical protein
MDAATLVMVLLIDGKPALDPAGRTFPSLQACEDASPHWRRTVTGMPIIEYQCQKPISSDRGSLLRRQLRGQGSAKTATLASLAFRAGVTLL